VKKIGMASDLILGRSSPRGVNITDVSPARKIPKTIAAYQGHFAQF
jgi:hypothetical protein